MHLLRIDSSARVGAVSRQLTTRFVERWALKYPGGTITERNLASTPLPPITDAWSATFRDPADATDAQRRYLEMSDVLIGELDAADAIVIGSPMYNFTISAPLKAWIDQIVRLRHTVVLGANGPQGMLHDKRVTVLTARGSSYGSGGGDFQEPYLRHILTFIGLTDVTFIHADYQYRRERGGPALAAALDRIDALVT